MEIYAGDGQQTTGLLWGKDMYCGYGMEVPQPHGISRGSSLSLLMSLLPADVPVTSAVPTTLPGAHRVHDSCCRLSSASQTPPGSRALPKAILMCAAAKGHVAQALVTLDTQQQCSLGAEGQKGNCWGSIRLRILSVFLDITASIFIPSEAKKTERGDSGKPDLKQVTPACISHLAKPHQKDAGVLSSREFPTPCSSFWHQKAPAQPGGSLPPHFSPHSVPWAAPRAG